MGGAVLKPNMVKNGLAGPRANHETVAKYTVQALLRTVPVAMPGIFFLSGETANDEDNEETATINLMTMNKLCQGTCPSRTARRCRRRASSPGWARTRTGRRRRR